MDLSPDRSAVAFCGTQLVAQGSLGHVAAAVWEYVDQRPEAQVLVLDAETSQPIEIDLRGTVDDVRARLGVDPVVPVTPRGPGRPKLGVVAKEVTLLPRHWEWLAQQPGGASVTLRKLVEAARKDGAHAQRQREGQDALYRFMLCVAGDEPGFEAASRALYAGDEDRFSEVVSVWPAGVRDHALNLARSAFPAAPVAE